VARKPFEALADFDRQRRAPGRAMDERGQIAFFEARIIGERDPHRRHAGQSGGPLHFDIPERGLHIEAGTQENFVAGLDMPQQDRGERIDVEQWQRAHHLVPARFG
jgi:hypothetical protein